jgi:MerR family transcriptional regulator/heat shock protein HspR
MSDDLPILTVTQAAVLAGMHPQTLRQYDRLGLVTARRTAGRGRRYSLRDVDRLREVQHLAQVEGVNLAGIKRILDLQNRVSYLEGQLTTYVEADLAHRAANARVFAAGATGDVVAIPRGRRITREIRVIEPARRAASTTAVVVWKPTATSPD